MRAIANEKISVFFGHVPVTIQQGEEVSGELAAFLLKSAPKKVTSSEPAAAPAVDGGLDIEATAADVLAWVGEEPERAAEALDAELAKDKPRSTLVKQLEKLADAGGE